MLVDGRTIAQELLQTVSQQTQVLGVAPRLTIITCTPNFETQKYLTLKKSKATLVGISVNVIELLDDCSTDDVVKVVQTAADQSDGIVVQLPLPDHVDTNAVLAHIPTTHDVDGIHYDGETGVLPPVVGAIATIAQIHQVDFTDKQVTVIGAGRLVGAPSLLWAHAQGANVSIITRETPPEQSAAAIAAADIIISGAGHPQLLTPDNIKDGAVIFDAGTSEDGGTLVGDADPACAQKASLLTPVPGGIGPITVACLLKNLLALKQQ